MPSTEIVAWGGWARNLRLANHEVELVVTLEVGPRIMRYAPVGGQNVLKEVAEDLGGSGESTWRLRGGHRLWVSPEDPARTYAPDNDPLAHEILGDGHARVATRPDPVFHLERSMEIELAARGTEVRVVHRVRNRGSAPATLAPWALTAMAPGGVGIVPLPSSRPHPGMAAKSAAEFAPALHLALWPYFRFDDPRVDFGRRYLRLRQSREAEGPTKLGLAHRGGWAAYWNAGLLFAKRFGYEEGASYPDGGCSFETYTDAGMLELESLGPLVTLAPGGETSHTEGWSLHPDLPAPESEAIVDHAFLPRIFVANAD